MAVVTTGDRSDERDEFDRDPVPAVPTVIAAVERGAGSACSACRRALCGHDVVMSFVLGFKDSARCLPCLAAGLGRGASELREGLMDHIRHRDCWSAGWRRANELEGFAADARPACASGGTTMTAARGSSDGRKDSRAAASRSPDAAWNAGDLGCGDLVLELRTRLNELRPGQTLELTARDPGAPADLPAWCGLTGHKLLAARHPIYLIERRSA